MIASNSLPFTRWFFYLFVATMLTVIKPYRSNMDNKLYSPSVRPYYETNGKLIPTPHKVFIDGRTAAYLNRSLPLHFALFIILLELMIGMLRRVTRSLVNKIKANKARMGNPH